MKPGLFLPPRSALGVHAVHRHSGLQVVRVQRVVVHVRVPVGVELVAEQRRRLRGRVQVQVVVVVAHVDASRQRVVVAGRILAVLLRAHGAVTWGVEGGVRGGGQCLEAPVNRNFFVAFYLAKHYNGNAANGSDSLSTHYVTAHSDGKKKSSRRYVLRVNQLGGFLVHNDFSFFQLVNQTSVSFKELIRMQRLH